MYNLIKSYTLSDAIRLEFKDKQFLSLKNLYENKNFSDSLYLLLIILNSLISFQLSGKGENYWEEFSLNLLKNRKRLEKDKEKIYFFFEDLLKNGKNNKRFVNMKLKRIKKLLESNINFISFLLRDWEVYYKNMILLGEDLSKVMNQRIDAKTIVFAIKMFSYGARNVFGYLEYFPYDLMIPIDSRVKNLYKKYVKEDFTQKEIKKYYIALSKKLNIPPLHLDAILWVNYDKFIK